MEWTLATCHLTNEAGCHLMVITYPTKRAADEKWQVSTVIWIGPVLTLDCPQSSPYPKVYKVQAKSLAFQTLIFLVPSKVKALSAFDLFVAGVLGDGTLGDDIWAMEN